MCPCRAFNESFLFVFFRQILGFCVSWDIWVLRDPKVSSKKTKNKTKKAISKKLGRGTLNTCAKFKGLTLKTGVDIWTFVRLSAKIAAWHRNYSVLVYIRFWSLYLTYLWSYAVRSSMSCAKLCTWYKHALEHLEAAGPETKLSHFLPTVHAYLLLASLKVCAWPGHIFGASASQS